MKLPRSSLALAILVLGVCWSPGSLQALDPTRTLFQYECLTWRVQNGLPARGINAITQDKEGFLWLGTQRGLVRYDGLEFKTLSLPAHSGYETQNILALAPSSKGGLWFGVAQGPVGFYSLESGFSRVQPPDWLDPKMN